MNLDLILHALVSTFYQLQYESACRLRRDPADHVLGKDVPNGARFTQWGTHEDDDELCGFLRERKLVADLEAESSYDNRALALKLDYATLRAHLAHSPICVDGDEPWLVARFVEYGTRLETSGMPGLEGVKGLPVHKGSFAVPAWYEEAMSELSSASYCRHFGGRAQWLPGIAPAMESTGRWVNGRTEDEVEQERLARVWDTMPAELKRLTLAEDQRSAWATLAFLMGHFWDDQGGWTYKPGDLTDDVFQNLMGGHSGAAAEIIALVRSGTLSCPEPAPRPIK